MKTKMIGSGVYNVGEASRFTGLKRARIREWFRGGKSERSSRLALPGDFETTNGEFAISFLDLIEVFVAGQLREGGVSLPTLRRAHARLGELWGTKHPFAKREIRRDGEVSLVGPRAAEGRRVVEKITSGHEVFDRIIHPALERIEYDEATGLARKWHLAPLVVLNPALSFGKPIVEPASLSTKILAAAFHANGRDARVVARWFDTKPEYVEAAVEFEDRFAA